MNDYYYNMNDYYTMRYEQETLGRDFYGEETREVMKWCRRYRNGEACKKAIQECTTIPDVINDLICDFAKLTPIDHEKVPEKLQFVFKERSLKEVSISDKEDIHLKCYSYSVHRWSFGVEPTGLMLIFIPERSPTGQIEVFDEECRVIKPNPETIAKYDLSRDDWVFFVKQDTSIYPFRPHLEWPEHRGKQSVDWPMIDPKIYNYYTKRQEIPFSETHCLALQDTECRFNGNFEPELFSEEPDSESDEM